MVGNTVTALNFDQPQAQFAWVFNLLKVDLNLEKENSQVWCLLFKVGPEITPLNCVDWEGGHEKQILCMNLHSCFPFNKTINKNYGITSY